MMRKINQDVLLNTLPLRLLLISLIEIILSGSKKQKFDDVLDGVLNYQALTLYGAMFFEKIKLHFAPIFNDCSSSLRGIIGTLDLAFEDLPQPALGWSIFDILLIRSCEVSKPSDITSVEKRLLEIKSLVDFNIRIFTLQADYIKQTSALFSPQGPIKTRFDPHVELTDESSDYSLPAIEKEIIRRYFASLLEKMSQEENILPESSDELTIVVSSLKNVALTDSQLLRMQVEMKARADQTGFDPYVSFNLAQQNIIQLDQYLHTIQAHKKCLIM